MMKTGRRKPDDFLFFRELPKKRNRGYGRQRPFISGEFIRRRHYEWIERAGVPVIRPHGTRHFFITQGQKNGMSTKDMQAMVGHKSELTTSQVYTHLENTTYLTAKAAEKGFGQQRLELDNVIPFRGGA
jgi:integrase